MFANFLPAIAEELEFRSKTYYSLVTNTSSLENLADAKPQAKVDSLSLSLCG
jgi:hypothetical protein